MPDERDFEIMASLSYVVEGLSNPDTASRVDKYFDNLESRRLIGSCCLGDLGAIELAETSEPKPLKSNFHSMRGH